MRLPSRFSVSWVHCPPAPQTATLLISFAEAVAASARLASRTAVAARVVRMSTNTTRGRGRFPPGRASAEEDLGGLEQVGVEQFRFGQRVLERHGDHLGAPQR